MKLKTVRKQTPFVWCSDIFNTQEAVEHAIAASLVENLDNTDSGVVVHGKNQYFIRVSVKLLKE